MNRQYIIKGFGVAVCILLVFYTYVLERNFLQPVSISSIFVLIFLGMKIYDELSIDENRITIQKMIDWTLIILLIVISSDIIAAFFLV